MTGLKEARVNKGLSQAELAAAIGVSQTVVSILETNDIYPGEALSAAIHSALGDFERERRKNKMSQNQKVLKYMIDNGKITQSDAVTFRCFRLGARIHDLRRAGYQIITETKYYRNEDGCGHYAEYRLAEATA